MILKLLEMFSHPMAMVSPKDEPVIEIKLTDIPQRRMASLSTVNFPVPQLKQIGVIGWK